MIAAYRLAASKMIAGDYYVTMYKDNGLNEIPPAGSSMVGEYDAHRFGSYSLYIFQTAGSKPCHLSVAEIDPGLDLQANA